MQHVYIQREGDLEKVKEKLEYFKVKTNEELIDSYNDSVNCGIVGVHAQGLHLIAMRIEFLSRFKKSPVTLEDEIIIDLSGKIRFDGKSYKNQIKISLLSEDDIINEVYVDSTFIEVRLFSKGKEEAMLFRLSHTSINTFLNLTDVSPYAILFFDEKLKFKGASQSIKSCEGSFSIQTQYKTILFVRHPNRLKLNDLTKLCLD